MVAGRLFPEWRAGEHRIVGCCLDLVAAFRQVPRLAAHAPHTAVSVYDPGEQVMTLFGLKALGFGQMAAV